MFHDARKPAYAFSGVNTLTGRSPQCAGCDEPIGGLSALALADGNRIHFDEENECLIRFGRRWHGDAIAGLRELGIEPPSDFAPP